MKKNPVIWTDAARLDLLSIVDYIADRTPLNAEQILLRLERRAESLDRFPERGRVVPELQSQGITTVREVVEDPWRIVYHFDGRQVVLVGILDCRRHLNEILMERFLRM